MIIDSHAHAWDAMARLSPSRRYTPRHVSEVHQYLNLLDRHGITHAVLIQPSFLADNNEALVRALRAAPERLRGVAVLEPEAPLSVMQRLHGEGIVGIRLNLIDQECPDLEADRYQRFLENLSKMGWHVEVHAQGRQWLELLPPLLNKECAVVIDHFGRPDPKLGLKCPGFQAILSAAATRRVWVKFSAPYRCPSQLVPSISKKLLAHLGPQRILWGSDYPWTQNESGRTYSGEMERLETLVKDPAIRTQMLGENPASLYGFGTLQ